MSDQNVHNMGIATPRVTLLANAPFINTNPIRNNFDISASIFPILNNSPFTSPLLAEPVIESDLGTFSVVYPSKRKRYVNNFLKVSDSDSQAIENFTATFPDEPYITWRPFDYKAATPEKNLLTSYFSEFNQAVWKQELQGTEGYLGPTYTDTIMPFPAPPNDKLTIKNYFEWVNGLAELDETEEQTKERSEQILSLNAIEQGVCLDGLWWGLESNDFITDNMPFWVNIDKYSSPSTSEKHPTSIVISFGLDSNEHRFDILLNLDGKPQLYDYLTSDADSENPYRVREWEVDLSRILKDDPRIEIGIMTAGSRLIIHVNKVPLVYTRADGDKGDSGGKIKECRIAAGKVRIYGTNIKAVVNACPMTYAPLSVMAFPVPNTNQLSGENQKISYSGVGHSGEPRGSVAELPTPPNQKDQIFGVDCDKFSGDAGECSPDGVGFHKKGNIVFIDSKSAGFAALSNSGFFLLIMQPTNGTIKSADERDIPIANMGCPYFFRLKGLAVEEKEMEGPSAIDITDYVISVSESANAPDYFHVKKSATITLYNENGILNQILQKQYAIQISWGWNGEITDTSFTGVITNVQSSESPGSETFSITCEDYMYVLRSTPIINSPFYDGMVAVYAILDLAKRGGCLNVQKDWSNENDYFLPSGFAYTQPAVRFPSTNMIFDCIMDLVKRFEAYCYFDGNGRFHINKLPGGLFSNATTFVADIVQDPSHEVPDAIILGEKSITYDFSSTVNVISILTLDRDTRNAIVYSHAAESQNKLIFRKPLLIDQPAYGELEVARKYARELGDRVFYPILKTNVKTVGGKFIQPLDFVKVLGHPFRVTSFKRNFSADNNDFSQDLECEWLGGK